MVSLPQAVDYLQVFRFALIGIIATALYTTIGIAVVSLEYSLFVANSIAFPVSLAFSYFGHHRYSFQLKGDHLAHFSRYILVTLGLVAATILLSQSLARIDRLDHRIIVLINGVSYAAASYLLNAFWSFRKKSSSKHSPPEYNR